MGDFSIYCNVLNRCFALSPNFATPVISPIRLSQGVNFLVDQYFVTPTGNPASPWTYLDPEAYSSESLAIYQLAQYPVPALAQATSPTYFSGSTPYLEYLLEINTPNLLAALGSAPSIRAVLEADWTNGAGSSFVLQAPIIVPRSGAISSAPPVTPTKYTGSVALAAGVGSFTLTGQTWASVPSFVSSGGLAHTGSSGSPGFIGYWPDLSTLSASGVTFNFGAYTPDAEYVLNWSVQL